MEPVDLRCGEIIHQSGEAIEYIYFPENCIITLQSVFADGSSIESSSIGYEGAAGAHLAVFGSA